ncbi:hypothetical protein [Streptomyces sp. NPDC018031]|uniref:hypothetical protein n=1 Tax=Streptomyces sp. NPDC018031 TaxID=3365033 RepID=UPI0037AE575B
MHEGHLLVLPRVHAADAGTDLEVTAAVMRRAAELMVDLPAANLKHRPSGLRCEATAILCVSKPATR